MQTYMTRGTCSRQILFDVTEDNKVKNVKFIGGCSGNLQAMARLVDGKDIDEVIVMGVSFGDADDAYYSDILVPRLKNAKWTFMLYGDDSSRINNFIHRHKLKNTDIQKW